MSMMELVLKRNFLYRNIGRHGKVFQLCALGCRIEHLIGVVSCTLLMFIHVPENKVI